MRKYVVMGVQGSGKGTQARLLAEGYDLVHISVGDTLRWNIQAHTRLGARVRRIMAAGQLVPDELIEELVERRLRDHDWNFGFVLEGFPRNVSQAQFFLEGYDIDAVILIDVPESVVFERMLSRRLCSRCGLDYNLISHRPVEPGTCDVCHGRLVQRADDTPDAIRARLHDYEEKTRPIVDLFRTKELVLVVDGTRAVADVQAAIRRGLALESPEPEGHPAVLAKV